MAIKVEMTTDAGEPVGVVTAEPRRFRTGSQGYYANGTFEIEGKQYQFQVQFVEIGSKKAGARGGKRSR